MMCMEMRGLICCIYATAILLLMVLMGCGGLTQSDSQQPVPRPRAFYRMNLPDSVYNSHEVNGVELRLNAAMDELEINDEKGWLTARYPHELATMYVTVNRFAAGEASREIDNRIERLSLNTGGAPTEITSYITSNNLEARIIITPTGTPTPVQFLFTDYRSIMISGTVQVEESGTAPRDSLMPVIKMLERDIRYLIP